MKLNIYTFHYNNMGVIYMSKVKIRFEGYRKIKPFWIDIGEANNGIEKVTRFYRQFFTPYSPTRYPIIKTAQKHCYEINGFSHKEHYVKPKIHLSKSYRRYYKRHNTKRFVVNTKINEWKEKGVYTVPILRTVLKERSLRDPSGINIKTKGEFEKIYLSIVLGTYFTNSVNYLNASDNCKVNFYYADNYNNPQLVTPTEFLNIVYDHYLDGLKSAKIFKMCRNIMINSVFGLISRYISSSESYLSDEMLNGFGSFKVLHTDIINGIETDMMIPLSTNNDESLMKIIKNVKEEKSICIKNSTFDITFIPGNIMDIIGQ